MPKSTPQKAPSTSPRQEAGASAEGATAPSLPGASSAEPPELSTAFYDWCQKHQVVDAAVYEEVDSGWRRLAHRGPKVFPRRLSSARKGTFRVLHLPKGLVLYGEAPRSAPAPCPESSRWLTAALKIVQLESQLKTQSFQAKYRGVELEALYDVGLVIASTLDLTELSEGILLRAVSLLDARRGAFWEAVEDRYVLRSVIGGTALDRLPVAVAEERGMTTQGSSSAAELLPGSQHAIAVAIDSEGQRRGLLAVADRESRHGVGPFSSLDHRTLLLFAHQAAIALENAHLHHQALEKERMDRDMELAAEIQQQILPKQLPQLEGYEVFGWNQPARQVGGDYFEARSRENGRVVLVVADVSGKGVPAALMVATLHSALLLSLDGEEAPIEAGLLQGLNRHLVDLSLPNKFITLLLVELDPIAGHLRYLNAGHNPGLLLRSGGGLETLDASGPPLGLLPEAGYRVEEMSLDPGDLLCLYSDGITECASPSEEEFGVRRLEEALRHRMDRPLALLGREIEHLCTEFAQGEAQGDDQTLLLLRRLRRPQP